MYDRLLQKKTSLSVVGLGYVGLPIALAFARKVKVIGFDINPERVRLLQQRTDPSGEMSRTDFEGCDITFTHDPAALKRASFHIVAVPTPIDEHAMPDLRPLRAASHAVGRILKRGHYVVYESTVYPGCTEEECIPILEQESGLRFGTGFKVGYSPERINPGDKEHTLAKITKVVSAGDEISLANVANVYELVVEAGVHRTSSIKVAEAAKIIENTQRDLNIALMNELSMIFDRLQINTYEVLEAAGTKWNFLRFAPGLVGGHCIGVDPYYLTYKSKELGHDPKVILSGRHINDGMSAHVAKRTLQLLARQKKNLVRSKILVMGATFKENVTDIRNSKVADLVSELKSFHLHVDVVDPHANSDELMHEYGFSLCPQPRNDYDAVLLCVAHREYQSLDEAYFQSLVTTPGLFVDVKGIYRAKIKTMEYWSL
ncbi:MAG: nucleotide sugar dehydrogenase [Ferruginibacter sp.]|nr:nucleotide sugar dehydrogenase [Cytophagales bacterium]